MSKPLGVGIIGAGPVTQAIHLPTISTLDDRLRVVHIMDVNAEVGASVARRSNARSSTDVQTLLDDPAVEVVAICSPGQFHAGQVEAATAAGKRERTGSAVRRFKELFMKKNNQANEVVDQTE